MRGLVELVQKNIVCALTVIILFAVPFALFVVGVELPVEILGICLYISICGGAMCLFLHWAGGLGIALFLATRAWRRWTIGFVPFIGILVYIALVFALAVFLQKAWNKRRHKRAD